MDRMSLEDIAQRWMQFWQGGSLASFGDLHAPHFIDHSAAGRAADREGLLQGIRDLYAAFPDFHADIDLLAVDVSKGLVTIRWSATGHMHGRFLGVEPTGRLVGFSGIEIIRVGEGQVVDRWGEWDEPSIREQIGAAPRA
ncbi:ester cyclase [Chelatococcus sp. GW1]|uniref:ester cyclase n=2 Tax=unclassified Chelatococcus TaxID=2638111 RepID=UPI0002E01B2C|nr:ester cyclase [Chelatococcus sp. GW1]